MKYKTLSTIYEKAHYSITWPVCYTVDSVTMAHNSCSIDKQNSEFSIKQYTYYAGK
jgi:hypothetical protein